MPQLSPKATRSMILLQKKPKVINLPSFINMEHQMTCLEIWWSKKLKSS